MRILLAEDEKELSRAIIVIFKHNHYAVDAVYTGDDALEYGMADNYDCIVLDIMMPTMSGLKVLEQLRKNNVSTPILLLTARAEIEDRIQGLDLGADDYLTKPFAMGELLARVRAITRRKSEFCTNVLTVANLKLNTETFQLYTETTALRLNNKEYQLMELLMSNHRRLLEPETLIGRVWGYEAEIELNVLWVYISNLRKKLLTLGAMVEINAVRGAGYILEEMK